jgi:hypothetical protein
MQTAGTFLSAGWDFIDETENGTDDIWWIDEGQDYPRLAWEQTPGDIVPEPDVDWLAGQGTADSPYQIDTADQLILLSEAGILWDRHFVLGADIDLDPGLPGRRIFGQAVIPVFSGVFDGAGHVIYNLMIEGEGIWRVGFFGTLTSGAEIRNIGVVDAQISSSDHSTGGLVGQNFGSVTASYSTGTVNGTHYVGGLVGQNYDGGIASSYSTSTVSASRYVGGLVGWNWGSIVSSYSAGTVTGEQHVGGLVGSNVSNYSSIVGSFWDIQSSGQSGSDGGVGLTTAEMMDPFMFGLNGWTNDPNWVLDAGRDYPRLAWEGKPGAIVPTPDTGWLAGQGTADSPYRIDTAAQLITLSKAPVLWDKHFLLGADIDLDPALPGRQIFVQPVIPDFAGVFDGGGRVISNLRIEGEQDRDLGLFGGLRSDGEIRNIGVVDAQISGGSSVGGLTGFNRGSIVSSYSTGTVNGTHYVGGLVGQNFGSVIASYSTSTASGSRYVGGLVGRNLDSIATSYSIGSVSGSRPSSHVGGLVGQNRRSVVSSFWDIQSSGQTASAGGIGLTTTQMHMAGTFLSAGWDFVDEAVNGTDDIWWILEGQDYPRLWWEVIRPN